MILTTDRLILREFNENDWQPILAYQSDPRFLRYYQWDTRTESDVRAFVRGFITWQQMQPRAKYQLAITLRAGGALIGNCGIRKKESADPIAEIGYEIAPLHWGAGYATEAARALVAFGFEQLRLHRIWAWCIAENAASARVLEKVGMRQEGRQREREWMKGRWWDVLIYGMLDSDWPSRGR